MSPFFSIIIPLYNKASSIEDTLNSVIRQTFTNFEIIVVNDGSTDASLARVNSLRDKRLRVISQKNSGVSAARNLGIKNAKADFIALLDGDDIWAPQHLEDLKVLYDNYPNCGLYGKAYHRDVRGIILNCHYHTIPTDKSWSGVLNDFFTASLKDNIATSSSVMLPKSTFERVGYFDETYNFGEDTDYWIRVALQLPVAFSNKDSVSINWQGNDRLLERLNSLEKIFDLNKFKKDESTNKSLKVYLDKNRLTLALQHKMVNNSELFKFYLKDIDKNNLKLSRRLLLGLPGFILKASFNFRNLLRNYNIDLRLFR